MLTKIFKPDDRHREVTEEEYKEFFLAVEGIAVNRRFGFQRAQ